MQIEMIALRKCPHCGESHPCLTLRFVEGGVKFKGKIYNNFTYCPVKIQRIYINIDLSKCND